MEDARIDTKLRPASVAIRPLSPALGAEIVGVDLGRDIDDDTFAQIQDAWHQNLVILLRGQKLREED
jgi:alpha-ketoglutarate-dependent taurine dioxygenase